MNLFTPDSVSKAAEKICFKDFFTRPAPWGEPILWESFKGFGLEFDLRF